MDKILITGGNGMVGKNLINYLSKKNQTNLLYPSRSELDLTDFKSVLSFINNNKPDAIIHCAGLVGGIQANIERPYSYLNRNLIMGSNLVEASILNKVPKLINLGSSCMYPANISSKLNEKDILSGKLEPTNEGYAIAKIAIAKLCEFAKKEFGLDYKTIIPCNLYGKWDKFDPDNSHMIPAVIRKLHLAKTNNDIPLIWGDGNTRREFMYAEDLADFIDYSLINYNLLESYTNVGLGYDYSILDYYKEIAFIVKYKGDFKFDLTKPSGMKRKLCSIKKQEKLAWRPKHTLKEGLTKTYKYYLENYGI
ncbi:GDP-L-fucose synthase [Flavobacteriaceae bacterium]|nr:GDP-L-fucose synthase [Flavobacteriaceae bacterium]